MSVESKSHESQCTRSSFETQTCQQVASSIQVPKPFNLLKISNIMKDGILLENDDVSKISRHQLQSMEKHSSQNRLWLKHLREGHASTHMVTL